MTTDFKSGIAIAGASTFVSAGTGVVTITVNGVASQTANLLEMYNSAGTLLLSVDTVGNIFAGNADVYKLRQSHPIMKTGTGNSSDDVGFYGKYIKSGNTVYGGLIFDQDANGGVGYWRLFQGNQSEPGFTLNTGGTGYTKSTLVADLVGNVAGTADAALTIRTMTDNSDTTCFPVFANDSGTVVATAKTNTTFTYNASTNALTCTTFIGALTGNASTASAVAAANLTGTTLASGVVTSSLTTVGTIGTGAWQGTVVAGQYGGTGVNNAGKTITVSGNTTIGSSTHTVAFATSNNTAVTLPASGTLATTAQIVRPVDVVAWKLPTGVGSTPATAVTVSGGSNESFDGFEFSASADQNIDAICTLSPAYQNNGITLNIFWFSPVSTTGGVTWLASLRPFTNSGTGVNGGTFTRLGQSYNYGAALGFSNVTTTVPGTTNVVAKSSITIPHSFFSTAGIAAGDVFVLRLYRFGSDNTTDTSTGVARTIKLSVHETP